MNDVRFLGFIFWDFIIFEAKTFLGFANVLVFENCLILESF